MDTSIILAGLSIVILLSYFYEFIGKKLKLPSVVLLVLSGIGVRFLTDQQSISVPYINNILPIFGTVGLILIVLEGALDLEVSKEKRKMIGKTFWVASLSFILASISIAALLHFGFGIHAKTAILNAIPFAVVSSAVAIPAARSLSPGMREFVTYESSFSDILGILFFNAILSASGINILEITHFIGNVVAMVILSLALAALLTLYIDKIAHHIKYMPILALLILVYTSAKMMHFSPLILILIFGLFVNNLELMSEFKWFKHLNYTKLNNDLEQFKQIVLELVFFIRTIFFLIFGFTVQITALFNIQVFLMAGLLFVFIIMTRWITLRLLSASSIRPILYFSPRGLITILLFLSIPELERTPFINNEVVVTTVLLTLAFLTFGNLLGERGIQDH